MSRAHQTVTASLILLTTGVLSCLVMGLTLGHRSDYLGHYAAGFGATLGLLVLVFAAMGPDTPVGRRRAVTLAVVVIGIALGAAAEATVFRGAQFDVVDFYNQNLGAVLAAAALLASRPAAPLPAGTIASGLVIGAGFVIVGFYYAFA